MVRMHMCVIFVPSLRLLCLSAFSPMHSVMWSGICARAHVALTPYTVHTLHINNISDEQHQKERTLILQSIGYLNTKSQEKREQSDNNNNNRNDKQENMPQCIFMESVIGFENVEMISEGILIKAHLVVFTFACLSSIYLSLSFWYYLTVASMYCKKEQFLSSITFCAVSLSAPEIR